MIPQFTSGLRPTASLNPVVDPVATTQRFFDVTAHFRSLSLSELYRSLSAAVLQTAPDSAEPVGADEIVPIGVILVLLVTMMAAFVNRLDLSEQRSHE
jgi:hypothetical protein